MVDNAREKLTGAASWKTLNRTGTGSCGQSSPVRKTPGYGIALTSPATFRRL